MEHADFSQPLPPPLPLPQYPTILPLPPLPPGNPFSQGTLGYYEPRSRKPPVWTVFAVLLIALVAYIAASFAAAALYTAWRHPSDADEEWRETAARVVIEPGAIVVLAAASQAAFLVVTVVAGLLSPMGIVRRLRIGPSAMSWLGYLTLPIGMLSINFLFQAVVRLIQVEQGGTLDLLHNAITHVSPGLMLAMLLVIGIAPGFAEEFLFRGYVQSRLAVRWGPAAAIVVAAALFGLVHFDKIQSPATFLMGLYLGYAAARAGSIRPSMFAHAFNNSTVVLVTWFFRGTAADEAATASAPVNPPAVMLQILGSLVLITLCCLYLKYRVHPPQDSEPLEPAPTGTFPVAAA